MTRGFFERTRLLAAAMLLLSCWLADTARADLQFDQPIVEAGDVRAGVPLTRQFAFSNPGPGVVEIVEARASCGCMTPRLSTRTLQPGERGTLTLDVNTLGQPAGPHVWRVTTFYCQGEVSYEMPLTLRANVVTEVVVQPASLTIFADQSVSHEILVTDLRSQAMTIDAVTPSTAGLRATLGDVIRDESGRVVRRIGVVVEESLPEGRHEATIGIHTSDPTYRELRVPITVVKRPRRRVSALPPEVVVTAKAGQPIPSRIVLLRDAQSQPVKVVTATCDHPAIACAWASGPGNNATVRVSLDRQQVRDDGVRATVTIQVSAPEPRTLTIPVRFDVD